MQLSDAPIRRVGLVPDRDPLFATIIEAAGAAARDAGVEVRRVDAAADEAGCDAVLIIGRPGRHRALLSAPADVPRIVWTGEPLPPAVGAAGVDGGPIGGSAAPGFLRPLGRLLRAAPLPGPLDRRRIEATTARLLRANLAEVAFARDAGATIVESSRDRSAALLAHGIASATVPFGYHERHAGPLVDVRATDRDIDLLSLGSRAGHTRRARLVRRLFLAPGVPSVDVVESAWGADRDRLLQRTKVVVDIHRIAGNFVGLRLMVAAAAGAVLVTEPMTDPHPFVPGVHHVEAPVEGLVDAALDLVRDDQRRAEMVRAVQALVSGELAMSRCLGRVLAAGR